MFKYIKTLLLLSALAYQANAEYPSNVMTGGKFQVERYFNNSGGLLDRTSPLVIPPRNASGMENVTLDTRGQIMKRNGYTLVSTTGSLSNGVLTGGGYFVPSSGSAFFAVIAGSNVFTTANTFNGTYTNVTGTTTLTASASNLAQTTNLNDNLIFCNESDQPFYIGATGNAFAISSTTFTGGKTCATYGAYLVIGNTTENSVSYPSRIRWSDVNNQNSFPTLNYIDVEPNDGDKVVSVIGFEDSVYIFKKRSIYRMIITGLDGADAFIVRPVSRNIGAWAKNSVRVVPNVGITFLAQNTVYTLSDEGLNPIGDPIQRTLDTVTRSMWANAVAAVYQKRYQYWLSVSTTSDSMNHEVLVYDYVQKAWTVYDNMAVNMLLQAEDSSGNGLLISGDYAGNVFKQDNGTVDYPGGARNTIPFSYTTPDLIQESPEFTKGYKYLYVFFNVVNSTTTVAAAFDYSTNYEYSQTISLGQIGALYDTAVYNTDTYPAVSYQAARVEINRSARSIKLKFSENSDNSYGIVGWALVFSPEDWKQ